MIVAVLVFGLILVRKFEDALFYDPFLVYFKGDFLNKAFPNYDLMKIAINICFRYLLNFLLSLGIIWFLFWDIRKVKFSVVILLGFFIILLPIYLYMIDSHFSMGETIVFYIRRFLIQPMLVLILIPAFYYQDFLQKQNTD